MLVTACSGDQSALNPKSADAAHVADLWWWMLGVGTFVLVTVTALVLTGALIGWGERRRPVLAGAHRRAFVLVGGVVLPLIAVTALVIASLHLGRDVAARAEDPDITVEIVGRQWWWEVRYLDEAGETVATTANEIHIPVGRRVRFLLKSDNVIHSFWVPNLQGKTDMIPGRTNETWLRADAAGTYRGQCTEFCGIQHAKMAFEVVAEPPDDFAAWLDRQGAPSALAGDESVAAGREAFLNFGCGGCHAVRGTAAGGQTGPDLTHFASRRTIGAATLPNTRDNLAAWITNAQRFKPGSRMPALPLPDEKLNSLLDYLEGLE